MRKCIKCGTEIINGVNGCAMLDECLKCHGPIHYPAPRKVNYCTLEELDYAEGKCISSV